MTHSGRLYSEGIREYVRHAEEYVNGTTGKRITLFRGAKAVKQKSRMDKSYVLLAIPKRKINWKHNHRISMILAIWRADEAVCLV